MISNPRQFAQSINSNAINQIYHFSSTQVHGQLEQIRSEINHWLRSVGNQWTCICQNISHSRCWRLPGWLCVEQVDNTVRGQVFKSFSDLIDGLKAATIIAIDVPIGLSDAGERPCDKLARKQLGPPRASSVFPAPIRAVLSERDYKSACEKHRKIDGRALTNKHLRFCQKYMKSMQFSVRQLSFSSVFVRYIPSCALLHGMAEYLCKITRRSSLVEQNARGL
jgi:hypothetical protein